MDEGILVAWKCVSKYKRRRQKPITQQKKMFCWNIPAENRKVTLEQKKKIFSFFILVACAESLRDCCWLSLVWLRCPNCLLTRNHQDVEKQQQQYTDRHKRRRSKSEWTEMKESREQYHLLDNVSIPFRCCSCSVIYFSLRRIQEKRSFQRHKNQIRLILSIEETVSLSNNILDFLLFLLCCQLCMCLCVSEWVLSETDHKNEQVVYEVRERRHCCLVLKFLYLYR